MGNHKNTGKRSGKAGGGKGQVRQDHWEDGGGDETDGGGTSELEDRILTAAQRQLVAHGYDPDWRDIAVRIKNEHKWKCERCSAAHDKKKNQVLTVHHLDGDKLNNEDWNLAALCQSCHLHIQAKVTMDQLFMESITGISDWFKPHYEGYIKANPFKPRPDLSKGRLGRMMKNTIHNEAKVKQIKKMVDKK